MAVVLYDSPRLLHIRTGTGGQMLPIAVLAWAAFQDSYPVTFWVAAEKRTSQTRILVVRNKKST